MTTHLKNIKAILTLMLTGFTAVCMAQTANPKSGFKKAADLPVNTSLSATAIPHLDARVADQSRSLSFKKGDEFQKTTLVNSTTVLQRGNQKFDIKSNSSVTKNYNITDASNTGFAVAVVTKRITDTLFAMGKSMQYNSDGPTDTSSFIQKRLTAMVGQTANVSLSKQDAITQISGNGNQVINDTLFAFTGLQPEQLVKGASLGLTVNSTAMASMKKNYTWADTVTDGNSKIKNTFWIQAKDDKTTTIAFESAQQQSYSNSNANGVYVVDNATGVILVRQMQSITSGYQVLNNVVYAASRRTAVTESCYKTR
ncbi:hypothetical protein [Mucilaginibacter flavus]|uniref:hypothetical protein n=1 Tax=Mucilaginibacter flavus TaxID=931504 RepID=UPI0025B527E4|nr:hypothetical protein [Mucilaginibacter flavus]MDN3579386.1 hypothetical protein [Mucilaginibacter flavus]